MGGLYLVALARILSAGHGLWRTTFPAVLPKTTCLMAVQS
jgi:hypothetical protein